MRFPVAALAVLVCPQLALAGSTTGTGNGGNGGGGRLGDVSGGLRGTTTPTPPPSPTPPRPPQPQPQPPPPDVVTVNRPIIVGAAAPPVVVVEGDGMVIRRIKKAPPDYGQAHVHAYAGAQRVFESEGAWHLELGVRDRQFGLRGELTRYYEEQQDGSNLTLTMPKLIGSWRIDDRGPTRVALEAGLVGARTGNDPVMDTSLAGGLGGIRLEHRLSRPATMFGEAHAMFFEDGVRAESARVGFKYEMLQVSLRVLDFNVGPALYGPELGVAF